MVLKDSRAVSHSQDVFPIQEGRTSKKFIPSYYLQVYRLGLAGYNDKEISERMKPPVRVRTLQKWLKDDPAFAESLKTGRNGSGSYKPEYDPRLTDQQKKFLVAYVVEGTISGAARVAGIERSRHHQWMHGGHRNTELYQEAYANAKQHHADYLYQHIMHRATHGDRVYKFHQGQPVMIECGPYDEGAKRVQDDEGNTIYVRHYYELKRSDMLLARLGDLHIPGFREDKSVNVNNNNVAGVDVGQLVDDLENGRRSNVMTVDAVSAIAQQLIEGNPDQ